MGKKKVTLKLTEAQALAVLSSLRGEGPWHGKARNTVTKFLAKEVAEKYPNNSVHKKQLEQFEACKIVQSVMHNCDVVKARKELRELIASINRSLAEVTDELTKDFDKYFATECNKRLVEEGFESFHVDSYAVLKSSGRIVCRVYECLDYDRVAANIHYETKGD